MVDINLLLRMHVQLHHLAVQSPTVVNIRCCQIYPGPSGATIMIMDTGIQSAGCEESCLGACSLPYHIHC